MVVSCNLNRTLTELKPVYVIHSRRGCRSATHCGLPGPALPSCPGVAAPSPNACRRQRPSRRTRWPGADWPAGPWGPWAALALPRALPPHSSAGPGYRAPRLRLGAWRGGAGLHGADGIRKLATSCGSVAGRPPLKVVKLRGGRGAWLCHGCAWRAATQAKANSYNRHGPHLNAGLSCTTVRSRFAVLLQRWSLFGIRMRGHARRMLAPLRDSGAMIRPRHAATDRWANEWTERFFFSRRGVAEPGAMPGPWSKGKYL